MSEQPIGLLASQINRSVRQLVAAQVEPLGLSTQQFWTIVAVAEQTTSSQAELAGRLRVDEATACRVVRSLADAELLSAVRDPDDRRRVRLELSPRGEALARRLVPVAREIRSAIDAALTPEERAATRAALGKVLQRLSAMIEAAAPVAGAALPVARTRRRVAAPPPARRELRRSKGPSTGRGSP